MKTSAIMLTAGLLSVSLSQAVTLSTFAFDGGSLAVTTELFTGSTSDITLGAAFSADAIAGNLIQDPDVSEVTASDPVNLVSFTYTVGGLEDGETLDITSFAIDFAGTTNTIRFNFIVDDETIGGNFNPPASGTYTNDLTITGLANGDSVDLAFASRDNGGSGFTADNFSIDGNISAIPEPTSVTLLGLCGALALLRRRRA